MTKLLSLRSSGTSATASRGLLPVFAWLPKLPLLEVVFAGGRASACDEAFGLLVGVFEATSAPFAAAFELLLGASDGGRVAVCEDA